MKLNATQSRKMQQTANLEKPYGNKLSLIGQSFVLDHLLYSLPSRAADNIQIKPTEIPKLKTSIQ